MTRILDTKTMLSLPLKKILIYYSILGLILLVAVNARSMTLAVEQDPGFCNRLLDVRINGDKLSLHADQVSLQNILRNMANLGIKIRIDPRINPKISASFEDRDIQKGVDSILKPFSYIMIWESIENSLSSPVKLSEIHVFKPGNKELMRPLHPGSILSIVRNNLDDSLFVKDEILLRLKPGMNLLELKRLLRRIGGRVVGENDALEIYKIRLPENSDISSLVEQITNHPGIAKAEPNYAYPISVPLKISASVIPVSDTSNIREPGSEARIAILDTGLSHDSCLKDFVPATLNALNPNESISDPLGHGTQMSLIAAGVVKPYGVRTNSETDTYNPIIPIRVFDDNGFTSNFALIESIDFALNNGARVMSLSWGSETRSDFLENTLDYASSKDLIIVAAAGNKPTGKPVYPAAYSSVIGIGALEPGGKAWENSNYGSFVMLYAPGFATLPVGYNGSPGTYAGTSISTAFTANIIADYLSMNPDATKREVFNALIENGVSIDR
jgi:thermitase